jgi:hypothetical protein
LFLGTLVYFDTHCFKLHESSLFVKLLGELIDCWLETFTVLGHPHHCIELASKCKILDFGWMSIDNDLERVREHPSYDEIREEAKLVKERVKTEGSSAVSVMYFFGKSKMPVLENNHSSTDLVKMNHTS